jgi:hypothetical protein
MINRERSRPLEISGNYAALGGAMFIEARRSSGFVWAGAYLSNAIVTNNEANDGAAFYLEASGSATSSLTMDQSLYAPEVQPCHHTMRCNRIEGNRGPGSVVSVNSDGTDGYSRFEFQHGYMTGNESTQGQLIETDGEVLIKGSLLGNNLAAGSSLIESSGGSLSIWNSTIAGNAIGASPVLAVDTTRAPAGMARSGAFPSSLSLHNSIVFQPGLQVVALGGAVASDLRNLLVNPGHGIGDISGLNIVVTMEPSFINPSEGDFQLLPHSDARNRWAAGHGVNVPAYDLNGAPRPADPPGTPTPYDFGAFEYGAVVDRIFYGSFSSPLP